MKNRSSNENNNGLAIRKGKKIVILIFESIAVCLFVVFGIFYFSSAHALPKRGTMIRYEGLKLYYEKEELSSLKHFMLRFKKGEKITEFRDEDIEWYKLKGADNIKTLIRKKGKVVEKFDFTNYFIEDNSSINMQWLLNNVFSISSGKDILSVTVDRRSFNANEAQKERLYNDLLSLHYPHTDEEKTIMENMSVISNFREINIETEDQTLNFLLYPSNNYLKFDSGVYSLFTILSNDYFIN